MKTHLASFASLVLLPLAIATGLAADERQALLREVDRAWELAAAGPVIQKLEFPGGTAFEYIKQLQAALGDPETAPLVVAVPPATLSDTAMPSVSLKEKPLSQAVGELSGKVSEAFSGKARLTVNFREGAWWIEEEKKDSQVTRTFQMEAGELQALGLVPQGDKIELDGKAWPSEPGASATYQGSKLIVRASPQTMQLLGAVLKLRGEGYKELRLKP
jgi:hypothetical protein